MRKAEQMRKSTKKKPTVPKKTPNPYRHVRGQRGLTIAWDEGYEAGRIDDPCQKGKKRNGGRHCLHWQDGDGDCCDCGKLDENDLEGVDR